MSTERGVSRSGARRLSLNNPYYPSYQELMSHHQRLTAQEPEIRTRSVRIADLSSGGSLLQTTVRFRFDSARIVQTLTSVFFRLFNLHAQGEAFEVCVTFNVVLSHNTAGSYSIFYGTDHRDAANFGGAAPELYCGQTTIVRNLHDVGRLPVTFDENALAHTLRNAFPNSAVSIHSFVNIVYLIYSFIPSRPPRHENRRSSSGQGARSLQERSSVPVQGSSRGRVSRRRVGVRRV